MNKELAKTLTTALVQFIDRERPEGTVCCSSYECEAMEQAFMADNFIYVEALVQRKLSGLTEFEQFMDGVVDDTIRETYSEDGFKDICKDALALAKKQLLSCADESNPAIEAMADLERTYFCNPDKLPKWLKDDIATKELNAHAKGYNKGCKDTEKVYKELTSIVYHPPIMPTPPSGWGCDGTHCTNPHRDCINCPQRFSSGGTITTPNTASFIEGNTSATDGKEHNPSFTD